VLGHSGSARSAADGRAGAAAGTRCPGTDLGRLAYVRGGALAVVDFEQCRPRTLVRRGVSGAPVFSRDGSFVSFDHGYVSSDGGPVHALPGAAVWSPRADVLAVATATGGIELISPGRFTRQLVPDGSDASAPAFAPNGKSVAFVRGTAIWTVDIASGTTRKLADARPGTPLPVGFSPDGRSFVYREYPNSASLAADGESLMAVDVRTGRMSAIASSIGRSDFVTWCGSALAYVTNHGGRSVTTGDGIAVASAPAWRSSTVLPEGGKTSWNAISCSGGTLVVSAGPSTQDSPFGQEHRSLWTVAAKPGAAPHLLAGTKPPAGKTDELPMWSADGRFVVFVRTTPGGIGGEGSIYAYDRASGKAIGPVAAVGSTGNYYGSYDWAGQIAWSR
jgi:WD40 repeat protein